MHPHNPSWRRRQLLAAAAGAAGLAGGVLTGCGTTPGSSPAGTARTTEPAHEPVLNTSTPSTFSAADLAHAERMRTAALADGTAWQLLQSLCVDVGARPAGSAADANAVAWAQAALRRLNLAQVRAEPFAMRAWLRGPASAQLLSPAPQQPPPS